MLNWRYIMDCSRWYHGTIPTKEKAYLMVKEIKNTFPSDWTNPPRDAHNEELLNIIEDFKCVTTVDDFNDAMEALYDFADYNHTCWIKTI